MKMKTRLTYSLLLPFLLTVACEDVVPPPDAERENEARSRIQVRNLPTEDLQLLVFDARSPKALESYYPAGSGADGYEMGIGDRIVAGVLNGQDLSAVADFPSLKQCHYVLGENDHPLSHPLRFGFTLVDIGQHTSSVSLEAGLQAGRVALLGVSNRLDGHQEIESLHVYLANAAADNLLGNDYLETAVRIHPDGGGTTSAWTDLSLGSLVYGASHDGPYYLFSCPTPPSWDPWLILAARISGRLWYYNIPLQAITKGSSQEVSVTIRTLGADTPCIANQPGSYDLVHALASWTILPSSEQI